MKNINNNALSGLKIIRTLAISVLVIFLLIALYIYKFQRENLTYYKTCNMTVSTSSDTHIQDNMDDADDKISYFVIKFKSIDGKIKTQVKFRDSSEVKMFDDEDTPVDNKYFEFFSKYGKKDVVDLSLFKDENGEIFPAMGIRTLKEAKEDYENCYHYQKTMAIYTAIAGFVIALILSAIYGVVQKRQIKKSRKVAVMEYAEAIKNDPEKMKDAFDTVRGHDIYQKTKAKYYAEQNPYADPREMKNNYGIEKDDYLSASKEVLSDKFSHYSNEKKGVADILSDKSKDNNKNNKY